MGKRLINVINEERANYLLSLGYKCMEDMVGNTIVYVFIEDENLKKILNDKSKFSKRDFYYNNVLRF